MAKQTVQDDFDEANVVPSNWVKFNVPMEDKIFGTLVSVREIDSTMPGKEAEKTKVYEIKAKYGSFHDLDEKKKLIEEPITIEEGELWNIGGRATLDKQMRNIKVGQVIGIKYTEEVPAKIKGYNPAKLIKVYVSKNPDGTPVIDQEFLASHNGVDDGFSN